MINKMEAKYKKDNIYPYEIINGVTGEIINLENNINILDDLLTIKKISLHSYSIIISKWIRINIEERNNKIIFEYKDLYSLLKNKFEIILKIIDKKRFKTYIENIIYNFNKNKNIDINYNIDVKNILIYLYINDETIEAKKLDNFLDNINHVSRNMKSLTKESITKIKNTINDIILETLEFQNIDDIRKKLNVVKNNNLLRPYIYLILIELIQTLKSNNKLENLERILLIFREDFLDEFNEELIIDDFINEYEKETKKYIDENKDIVTYDSYDNKIVLDKILHKYYFKKN